MPRNPNNPKKALSLDEKLQRKLDKLAVEGNINPENINLVNKFINSAIREGKSRQSCLTYLVSLTYVFKNTDINFQKATVEDIESMLTTLEMWTARSGRNKGNPLSPFTKNTIKGHTKTFLKYLGYTEIADVIKCKNLKGKKLPEDILTKDEVLSIIDRAGSIRDKALFGLLYETGCRSDELLSMKVKNIEFLHNGGCAATFPQGKTGPRRVLFFNFAPYLRQWLDAHPLKDNPEGALWPTTDYRLAPLTNLGVRYLLNETVKRTGIKKRVYIHGFRHARATHIAEHLTEQQMKSYLGWTQSSDMAAVYVHLSGKDIDKAVMAMNGIEDIETPIDTMKAGKCPRCAEMNAPKAKYCMKCGLPLSKAVGVTELETRNDMSKIVASDSVLMGELMKRIQSLETKLD